MTTAIFETKALEELEANFPNTSLQVLTQEESEAFLEGKKEGSYLFREDPSGKIYLAGIGSQGELHHAKIEKNESKWVGMNGGIYKEEKLSALICSCLHCEEVQLVSTSE